MKILITDDEKLIRSSIHFHLLELGFSEEDIDEASDGEMMLEKLKENRYDIALVDVKMPVMDGLDAIRQGIPHSSDTLFYILSGFDEFKYAQEAVRLGVKDYLLKPIRKIQLEKIIEDAVVFIEKQRSAYRRHLKALLSDMLEEPEKTIEFPIKGRAYLTTCDSIHAESLLNNELFGLTQNLFYVERSCPEGTLFFLFPEHNLGKTYSDFIQRLVKSLLHSRTVFECSAFSDSNGFYKDYKRVRELSRQRPVTGIHHFYKKSTLPLTLSKEVLDASQAAIELLDRYNNKNYSDFMFYSKQLIHHLASMKEAEKYQGIFYEFIRLTFCLDEPVTSLELQLDLLSRQLLEPKASKESIVTNAVEYIRIHYNEDVSIHSMADLYSITPNYFSSIFHKNTGKTFIQYLTHLRIQEGKRLLLETDLTINEITEKIGYYSTSYFIKRFMQSEGMTPAEFRNRRL